MNRGSPSALKCTMPSTVIRRPHRGRKTSISRKSGCSRPGRWRPWGSQSRNLPLPPYLISSSRPLTTNAFGAILFEPLAKFASALGQPSASGNPIHTETWCGRDARAPGGRPVRRVAWPPPHPPVATSRFPFSPTVATGVANPCVTVRLATWFGIHDTTECSLRPGWRRWFRR